MRGTEGDVPRDRSKGTEIPVLGHRALRLHVPTSRDNDKSPFRPLPCFSEVSAQILSCEVSNRQWLSRQDLTALLSVPNEWPGPAFHPPPGPRHLGHQSQASGPLLPRL